VGGKASLAGASSGYLQKSSKSITAYLMMGKNCMHVVEVASEHQTESNAHCFQSHAGTALAQQAVHIQLERFKVVGNEHKQAFGIVKSRQRHQAPDQDSFAAVTLKEQQQPSAALPSTMHALLSTL
jgi:hypothetical protein